MVEEKPEKKYLCLTHMEEGVCFICQQKNDYKDERIKALEKLLRGTTFSP
jgi:hypothetical protein